MDPSKLAQALFSGVLALAASSGVHARPVVFEPRDDDTFSMRVSKAVPGMAIGRPGFALSGASTTHGGHLLFGTPHATSPFGSDDTSFDSGDSSAVGWASNARASSNHEAHENVGAFATANLSNDVFVGSYEHGVAPVPPIPEPSTYALLALGLAGIAVATRRRRLG